MSVTDRIPAWTIGAIALGAMAAVGFTSDPIRDRLKVRATDKNLNVHDQQAAASLIGQFRTSASAWLWLKADLYLHNNVEMRPLTKAERDAGKKGVGGDESGPGAIADDENIVSVIPDAAHDFRGWMGDIERASQAYTDMAGHTHNDPEQALPLYRLMVWIDPSFVPAWLVGSTVLGRRDEGGLEASIAFLEEGLKANPSDFSILSQLGWFYAGKKKDYAAALKYLDASLLEFEKIEKPDEDLAENAMWAFRWKALCHRELDQLDLMKWTARVGLTYFKDDPVLLRSAYDPPYFLSLEGVKEWQKAALKEAEEGPHEDHEHEHEHEG